MVINLGNGLTASTSRRAGVDGAILGHSGVEHPVVEVRGLESTLRDGGTIFGTRYPMRRMTLAIDFRGVGRQELARRFVPGVTYRLESERGRIDAVLDSFEFAKQNLNSERVSLSYLSQAAFVSGDTVLLAAGSDPSGGFTYPYTYPFTYQDINAVDSVHFIAQSDVDTEPVITLTVGVNTSSLDVSLNGTLTLDTTLIAGDVVRVDSAERTVTINGVLALDVLDIESEWPVVVPGNNTLTLSQLCVVSVQYDGRVMGLL